MNHDVVLAGDELVPVTVLTTMQLLADLLSLVFTVQFTLPNLLIYDLIVLAEQTRSRAQRFQAGTKLYSYLRTTWLQVPPWESFGLSLSRTHWPASIQNPLDIKKGPQKES